MQFKLTSLYKPAGDQPQAIKALVNGILQGEKYQTLLGVTGSGNTFTMANVISELQRPSLILTHNKTLVAQLYGEFKQFFPENAVEYFVSYYDYYQPEAYIPVTNTYIEKDLLINDEIEKLRLRATSSLMSGRRDIVVVASVSCIYGMGNPNEYKDKIIYLNQGDKIGRNPFLRRLVEIMYSRTEDEFNRGTFRVRGDTVDVFPPYADDYVFRVVFFGDEIDAIERVHPESGKRIETLQQAIFYPANLYLTDQSQLGQVLHQILDELQAQKNYFESVGKHAEADRIYERVQNDIEMIKELGYCSGIENYSRFFDNRKPGQRPFCLLDYFPEDYLLFLDESHVSVPQISGMYGGDRSRKLTLVDYGFRLPSALDNRPQSFQEFEQLINQIVYVSATPGDYEMTKTGGEFIEQVVRPTGLLDPPIQVRPSLNQIDDLIGEINQRVALNERILVTTLTKRMAEELSKYLTQLNINCKYIHSEVDALERVEIIRGLRLGDFDVLVGINLLREGLDLPEVSLVAILDADKEGFLRNERSLTQTSGRAARNANGLVIMYADRITKSMQATIDETNRRRAKQIAFNEANGITPQTVLKSREQILEQTAVVDIKGNKTNAVYIEPDETSTALAADPIIQYMTRPQLEKSIEKTRRDMLKAAKEQDFMAAARLRDELFALQNEFKKLYEHT